jgi:hypothetical protein
MDLLFENELITTPSKGFLITSQKTKTQSETLAFRLACPQKLWRLSRTRQNKPLSVHLNILVSLALAILLICDLETRQEKTNLSSRTSSLLGSTLLVHLGPALLTLLVSLLFLGKWLDLVGVEDAFLATLNPVVVAGVMVEDLLVEEVSGLSDDLGAASCRIRLSAR